MDLKNIGVFETMRAFHGNIVYLDAHLDRIKKAARIFRMELNISKALLRDRINQCVKSSKLDDARVKLLVWKKKNTVRLKISIQKYQPFSEKQYKRGFKVCLSILRQNSKSLYARFKTTNRAIFDRAYRDARKNGMDEAIISNEKGFLCEGTRSNLFFVRDNTLFTPALKCGCLDGITRKVILDLAREYKIKLCQGCFTFEDLESADEAFLTNSLIGIMPIRGKCGPIVKFLSKKYNYLLK